MPKVIIAEKDLTSAGLIETDDNIVLIPSTFAMDSLSAGQEKYYASTLENISIFESNLEAGKENVAFKMAFRLLNLGMTVLYRVIGNQSELDETAFWTPYSDKSKYNLRFITAGGYASAESATAMGSCAAVRGDAIALVDVPTGEAITVELYLKEIHLSVDELTLIVSNEFNAASVSGVGTFVSGSISETGSLSQTLQNITFSPAAPEEGTHSVVVSASYQDAQGESCPVIPAVVTYTFTPQE